MERALRDFGKNRNITCPTIVGETGETMAK